ncbi:hypothetical protein [Streptomyces sp. NPDC055107]
MSVLKTPAPRSWKSPASHRVEILDNPWHRNLTPLRDVIADRTTV